MAHWLERELRPVSQRALNNLDDALRAFDEWVVGADTSAGPATLRLQEHIVQHCRADLKSRLADYATVIFNVQSRPGRKSKVWLPEIYVEADQRAAWLRDHPEHAAAAAAADAAAAAARLQRQKEEEEGGGAGSLPPSGGGGERRGRKQRGDCSDGECGDGGGGGGGGDRCDEKGATPSPAKRARGGCSGAGRSGAGGGQAAQDAARAAAFAAARRHEARAEAQLRALAAMLGAASPEAMEAARRAGGA
ncbi:hypothetical protein Rsub_07351 [Raphidocelis subcapitata]|uniref:Uncharacterized protein n=1 Tax=Raphidocelis subcapitata TaxID=307507 RepID=A0A2V0P870_9CHLO|nr:hypothetical protein Rsub_07351 [Raphidocelis subcapitata]|eukprot:GBF94083.1 hypothetical protein Rsub_07351 [Raphidocelis subcapitata]